MSKIGQEGVEKVLGDFTDEDRRLAERIGAWLLQHHDGEALYSAEICKQFDINDRKLRKMISYLRFSNRVKYIISTARGYKVTRDEAEVRDFIEYMRARASATAAIANVMSKAIGLDVSSNSLFGD